MSDALIASLNKRVDELTTENASLKAEARDRRLKGRKATTELDELKKQVATLTTERDGYKTKAESTPTQLQSKITELEGKLRTRDHQDAFKTLFDDEELGLNKSIPVDKLWKILDYKAEADQVDLPALKAKIAGLKSSDPYLFGQPAGETPAAAPGGAQGTARVLLDAAAGSGRGAPDNASRQFRVTTAQRSDPGWMRANQKAMSDASAAGTLVFLP